MQDDSGDERRALRTQGSPADSSAHGAAPGSFERAALHLSRSYQEYLDAASAPYGVSSSHVPLLVYLAEGGDGHTQNDIARATDVDKGTVSRRVAQLVRMGLIAQVPSERDSRAYRVTLTERGHELVEPITAVRQRWREGVAGGLSEAARDQLLDELNAMNTRADRLLAEARSARAPGR